MKQTEAEERKAITSVFQNRVTEFTASGSGRLFGTLPILREETVCCLLQLLVLSNYLAIACSRNNICCTVFKFQITVRNDACHCDLCIVAT